MILKLTSKGEEEIKNGHPLFELKEKKEIFVRDLSADQYLGLYEAQQLGQYENSWKTLK